MQRLRDKRVRKQSFMDGQLVMMTSIQFACLLLLLLLSADYCNAWGDSKSVYSQNAASFVTVVAWQTTNDTHLGKQLW